MPDRRWLIVGQNRAGPCLRQYPILDKLLYQYQGRLLMEISIHNKERVIAKQYGIASVPSLKLFRFGEVVETLHGFQSTGRWT